MEDYLDSRQERQSSLRDLFERCLAEASNHIKEASSPALILAVQETNLALCAIFSHHLLGISIEPETDHDRLVSQMIRYADPPLDSDLAEYLYKAHEKLRVRAYHLLESPLYYEALQYSCVPEVICTLYGIQTSYAKYKLFTETIPYGKLLRLLPIENRAYAYVDYEFGAMRHPITSVSKSRDAIFYYPTSWELRSSSDCDASAESPLSLGRLSFWAAQNQEANDSSKSIPANWALNLARNRLPAFDEVKLLASEDCYIGDAQGTLLTLDLYKRGTDVKKKSWARGLYMAIGSQPGTEILFFSYPIAFSFLSNLIRACMFSSHPTFLSNGNLVKRIVSSIENALNRKLIYRGCVIKNVWDEEWFRLGVHPNQFVPDFRVIKEDDNIGYGVILTQPASLELVLERWAKIMPEATLFLVIPKDSMQDAKQLCEQYGVYDREIMRYDTQGEVDRPRR